LIKVVIYMETALQSWAFKEALSLQKVLSVVGVAQSKEQALKMIGTAKVNVLMVDMNCLDVDAFAILTSIPKVAPDTKVVAIVNREDSLRAGRAMRYGCTGFVSDDASGDTLCNTLQTVASGTVVSTNEIIRLAESNIDGITNVLSQRELQVMEMLALGHTNREIAQMFEISIKTVDTHRGHVLKKLQLRNNSDLTRFAVKHGYVKTT
jgi:two-component system, NarL family, invasion response regulator UvrY